MSEAARLPRKLRPMTGSPVADANGPAAASSVSGSDRCGVPTRHYDARSRFR